MTSETARRATFAPETDEAFIYLVTITHPELPEPVRLAQNNDDIISRGDLYIAAPLELTLPDSTDDQMAQARFRCPAVQVPDDPDLDIVLILRNLGGVSPTVTLECVVASDPDVVQRSAPNMLLSMVDFDGSMIDGDLVYSNWLGESYPGDAYNKKDWPGVHE